MVKKKLLIVLIDGRIHRLKLGSFMRSFREAPLTATFLAALVPPDLPFDISIADESIGQNPRQEGIDMVAISLLTGTSIRGYELADWYRSQGTTVVLGGVHVTLLPDEAAQHADAIVTGFAEIAWPQLLRDYLAGQMQSNYKGEKGLFEHMPVPRRDLQSKYGYMVPNTVSATRGCKSVCDFCSISAANFGWNKRPISEVIQEIKGMGAKRIVFNDVSMGEDPDYFKELMRELIPLRLQWGGLVSTKVFRDPEMLPLMSASGCVYLLIGFESLNNYALKRINKGFNKLEEYKMVVDGMHQHNIVLMGCFIFGFDEDDKTIFQQTLDFVNDYKIDIPRYAIYTPYPGTQAFDKLKKEDRLLHTWWHHYDTQHVVFRPANMTPQELDEGFKWAYKKTFQLPSVLKRTLATGRNFPITFGGNLAYNIYIRRLFAEQNRIHTP